MSKLGPMLLAACLAAWPAAAQQPQRGGTLTFSLNADIRSLEPGINRDGNTDIVAHQIYEGLVGYRADLTVGPALAASWTASEDGKVWTFKLRDNAVFHNGARLTAAYVKAAWDRQWGNPAWTCKRSFDQPNGLRVLAVEAPDPQTVIYRLESANALFLPMLANVQCGTIIAHPDSFDAEGKFANAIGTGPWKLGEWRRGQFITLQRFDEYGASPEAGSGYAGRRQVWLDRVTYRVIPDPAAAEAALLTGAVDVIPDLDTERVDAVRGQGMNVEVAQGLGWSAMLIQTNDPVLKDVRIRRAIAHALNMTELAEAATSGVAKPSPSPVSPAMSFFDDSFRVWPEHDLARARALLREAGYRNQVIKLQTNRRYPNMYANSVAIQAMLTAAGLRVELEVLDWATQLSNYQKGDFQLQSFSYSARLDTSLAFNSLIGDKTRNTFSQWDNPAAIELLQQSTVETDQAKRADIFRKLHAMMAEDVPTIGLYFAVQGVAVRPGVHGVRAWAAGRPLTWDVWRDR